MAAYMLAAYYSRGITSEELFRPYQISQDKTFLQYSSEGIRMDDHSKSAGELGKAAWGDMDYPGPLNDPGFLTFHRE